MSATCETCDKKVYAAEWVSGPESKKYHKLCLKCVHCNKQLQPGQFPEKDGKPYCKTDYDRLFRIAGYGHGDLSSFEPAVKTETTVIEEQPVQTYAAPEAKNNLPALHPSNCPKCGKKAYFSEMKHYNSRDWHKTCFTCFHCNKNLVSGSYSEKDGYIFCPRCYQSNYSIKGFGFGGSAVLH
ncbi:hypothetical protein DICPUDRAFT_91686 [Dictyostelium purpureum]|uniref:LIM zinc-binding domain-containing protein n=1 Tax=Dictyostelium purpureum TaxID=5786 RepID=F0ZFX3_DICPU|nr:uncharacterized protein DICPUDRAFT_91686 [Dictyostelium purpureum]EGC37168.1 hypothetical protein DICPUDRAFT_91686 [Dictyostelium purpureum]|eukprot:XP_003286296.1 hypothetical protein DICPUDRAFT_91686 [Dictyostelium purpureum]